PCPGDGPCRISSSNSSWLHHPAMKSPGSRRLIPSSRVRDVSPVKPSDTESVDVELTGRLACGAPDDPRLIAECARKPRNPRASQLRWPDTSMRATTRTLTLVLGMTYLGAVLLLAGSQAPAGQTGGDGPRFVNGTELVKPADYREWIFLSSGLGMTYQP